MIQTENILPIPDEIEKAMDGKSFFDSLQGLSIDDALTKMANGLVDFAFKLLIAILVFYAGRFIISKLYRFTHNIMTKRQVDPSLMTFVLSLLKMVLYFILIITVIGILGLETSSFLAIFASAGVAIGMALSGTLQNFAGGVLILLLKPYKVGDYIEAAGYAGTVKAIQIFHTIINTPDNKTIIIPNGGLSTGSINNFSAESSRRVDWVISLSYSTDYDAAEKAIKEILLSDERTMNQPDRAPFVGLGEMGDNSINITVRAWTDSSNYWGLFFDMNKKFYTELPKRGFEFPFPQLDVHIEKTL